MNKRTFCKNKFGSMLISGTFTMAVLYLMMLSDSIIAGLQGQVLYTVRISVQ